MTSESSISLDELTDIYLLDSIKGFGPQKFKTLYEDNLSYSFVLSNPQEMRKFGKRGITFQEQLEKLDSADREKASQRALKQIKSASSNDGAILTYDSPLYPKNLYDSNLPVPVLYARGDLEALRSEKSVACVGSRKIREPYREMHHAFACEAIRIGFTIVSGFATGADIIGHLAAANQNGTTVCVMPSGLDRPFPPEHREIWRRLIVSEGAVFVSEFGFGVGANSLNLRKRNKMIVGMALGVLVSQSTKIGGAMNAYRFANEQRKPVATFESDGADDTDGNGLIGEGSSRGPATVFPFHETSEWTSWLQRL